MLLVPILFALAQADRPVVVLDREDLEISRSCVLRVPAGRIFADPEGDGVVRIVADDVVVVMEEGSVLRGAPPETPLDRLEGVGILLDGVSGVVLRGLRVEGYRCAVLAHDADGLLVEDAVFQRNFAQRLRSTPEAEDGADWLWPHANDDEEWRRNYGAAVSIHRSGDVTLRRIRVRSQQNGLLLDRVHDSRVYDCDASFLSGWGLAMWRSERNLISRNAFDFCVRGYSHGVYNRGQDSAGILCFEQSSDNAFLENSVTHGGDGFFAFAGREALGEAPPPSEDFSYEGRGCNRNVFVGNDFSYAAAHGLELTFSFGAWIADNRFVENAICGIWGGFSRDLYVHHNRFSGNGELGYGLERGGVNVDHPRGLYVYGNDFVDDRCGVHLWNQPTAFGEKPWGRANPLDSRDLWVVGNRFVRTSPALHLRGRLRVATVRNRFVEVAEAAVLEGDADLERSDTAPEVEPWSVPPALGDRRPVGARARLRGRRNIVMTEWGPWDHVAGGLFAAPGEPGARRWRVLPADPDIRVELVEGGDRVQAEVRRTPDGVFVVVRSEQPGWASFRLHARGEGWEDEVVGSVLRADWRLWCFPTPFDPREDAAAWEEAVEEAQRQEPRLLPELRLPFGGGGPTDLLGAGPGLVGEPGRDHFGCVAETELRLPQGTWRLVTTSDDGIRVRVGRPGAVALEDWTWHAPRRSEAEFRVTSSSRPTPIRVEWFELDGHAVLELRLERAD